MIKAFLLRLEKDSKQTLGAMHFYLGLKLLLSVKALELTDRNNQTSISRIPAGRYRCILRWSTKYKWHFIVLDVEGREWILIHFGNYYRDTRGCILVGNDFYDINKDGYKDVTSSKKTIKRILNLPGDEFELIIIDE